jgi:hypothetical protein
MMLKRTSYSNNKGLRIIPMERPFHEQSDHDYIPAADSYAPDLGFRRNRSLSSAAQ